MFAGRILSFDLACTHAYAELIAQSRDAGFNITTADGYIASIAISNGVVVASRNITLFHAAGARVINPWNRNITPLKQFVRKLTGTQSPCK